MTVSELIEQLMEQPLNAEIELLHFVYSGGGDETTFSDVEVVPVSDSYVLLAVTHHSVDQAKRFAKRGWI